MLSLNNLGSQHSVTDYLNLLNNGTQANSLLNALGDSSTVKKGIMSFITQRSTHIAESIENFDFIQDLCEGRVQATVENLDKISSLHDTFSIDGSGTVNYFELYVAGDFPRLTMYEGEGRIDCPFSIVNGYFNPTESIETIVAKIEQSIASGFSSVQLFEYIKSVCACLSGDASQLSNFISQGLNSTNDSISALANSLLGLQSDKDYGILINRMLSIILDLTTGISKDVKDSSDGDPGELDISSFANDLSTDFIVSSYTVLTNVANAAMSVIGIFGGVLGMAASGFYSVVSNLVQQSQYPQEISFGSGTDMRFGIGALMTLSSETANVPFSNSNREVKIPGLYIENTTQKVSSRGTHQANAIVYPSCNGYSKTLTKSEDAQLGNAYYSTSYVFETDHGFDDPHFTLNRYATSSLTDFESTTSELVYNLNKTAVLNNLFNEGSHESMIEYMTKFSDSNNYNEVMSKLCKSIILHNLFSGLFNIAIHSVIHSGACTRYKIGSKYRFTTDDIAAAWTNFKSLCHANSTTTISLPTIDDSVMRTLVSQFCCNAELMTDSGADIVLWSAPEWSDISKLIDDGISIEVLSNFTNTNTPGLWCSSAYVKSNLLATVLSFYCWFISTQVLQDCQADGYYLGNTVLANILSQDYSNKVLYTYDSETLFYTKQDDSYNIPIFDVSSNDYPNYPTDPFIKHPKFNASSIRRALMIGVGVTVATTAALIIGKVAVKKISKKIMAKKEAEAVQAQNAYFNADPSTMSKTEYNTLQKNYLKAQRKFSRCATLFGYSSNNVGAYDSSVNAANATLSDGSDIITNGIEKALSYNDATVSQQISSIPTTDYSDALSDLDRKLNHIITLISGETSLENSREFTKIAK